MRILTYNIWNYSGNWARRRWALVEAMAGAGADVIGLQEVRHTWNDYPGHNQAKWLGDQMGYHWYFRPANIFVPFPPVVEGLAFLSRRPLAALDWREVPALGRGPRRLVLHARHEGIEILNVHYPLSEPARIQQSRVVLDIVTSFEGRPAVVLGDFNADGDQAPMSILWRGGLTDLWSVLPARHGAGKSWPARRRIDYVLSRGVDIDTWWIETVGTTPGPNGVRPSDHFGVLVGSD